MPAYPLPSATPDTPLTPDLRIKALRRFAASITALTVIGHAFLGFEQAPLTPVATLAAGYAAELLLETLSAWAQRRPPGYRGGPRRLIEHLLPTHIAALACAMLLYGNSSFWPYLFAVSAAVVSRHLLRVRIAGRARHVLNPSNFGIALTLLLFPWVAIAPPYQFTASIGGAFDWLLPLAVLMLGTRLNTKLTGRMPLIAGWIGGFVAQAAIRALVFDHAFVGALLPMTGLAFILFTNYMITDPGTTPARPSRQVAFGAATAAVYGILVLLHVAYGFFFALVIVCAVRGIALAVHGRRRTGRHRSPAVPAVVTAGAPR